MSSLITSSNIQKIDNVETLQKLCIGMIKKIEKCTKKKINCPQNCFMQISRESMVKLIKEVCPNTLIHCKLFEIGCKDIWLSEDDLIKKPLYRMAQI